MFLINSIKQENVNISKIDNYISSQKISLTIEQIKELVDKIQKETDDEGMTSMHLAFTSQNKALIDILVAHDFDININGSKEYKRKTPLDVVPFAEERLRDEAILRREFIRSVREQGAISHVECNRNKRRFGDFWESPYTPEKKAKIKTRAVSGDRIIGGSPSELWATPDHTGTPLWYQSSSGHIFERDPTAPLSTIFTNSPRELAETKCRQDQAIERIKYPHLLKDINCSGIVSKEILRKVRAQQIRGTLRKPGQKDLIGVNKNAVTIAATAGFGNENAEDWQFCHGLALCLGGKHAFENLFVGTKACNGNMLAIEMFVIDLIQTGVSDKAKVTVEVKLDPGTLLGQYVNYAVEVDNCLLKFTVNPKGLNKPYYRYSNIFGELLRSNLKDGLAKVKGIQKVSPADCHTLPSVQRFKRFTHFTDDAFSPKKLKALFNDSAFESDEKTFEGRKKFSVQNIQVISC